MKYQPSLDGVRAISVLLVMSHHFGLNAWGHVGVDIFFVLSGFLITTILIGQRHQKLGHYLSVFYQRRALRIFPLYYGYVLVLAVSFLLWCRPLGFDTNWPYLITYTVNFAELDPNWFLSAFYGHLWSLSAEAQFYLFWPLLIYFLSPKGTKVLMLALLLVCPLIRTASYALLSDIAPAIDAFGSLPALRASEVLDRLPVSCWDAFATGALIHIARLTTRSRKFWAWAVLVLGVTTIGYGALLQSVHGPELGRAPTGLLSGVFDDRSFGFTLRNFWIACFLVAALEWRALRSVLSLPAVVLLGQISYGMYVFHWPILVPFRRLLAYEPVSPLGVLVFVAYSATVVAVSYASYRWFESWFLLRKLPYAKTPPPSQPEQTER